MCAHMHQTPRSKNTLNTLITSHTCEASCLRLCIPTATEFVLEQIIWLLFINIYIYISHASQCVTSNASRRGLCVAKWCHTQECTHTHAHHHTGTLPQTNRIMSEENCVQRIRTRAHFVVSVVCLGGDLSGGCFFSSSLCCVPQSVLSALPSSPNGSHMFGTVKGTWACVLHKTARHTAPTPYCHCPCVRGRHMRARLCVSGLQLSASHCPFSFLWRRTHDYDDDDEPTMPTTLLTHPRALCNPN